MVERKKKKIEEEGEKVKEEVLEKETRERNTEEMLRRMICKVTELYIVEG